MKFSIAILALAYASGALAAADVPSPQPQAGVEPHPIHKVADPDFNHFAITDRPTDCDRRIAQIAEVVTMRRLIGPGSCGGDDMVRVETVLLADHSRVAIKPAPALRCTMAEQLALWVRDDAAPQVKTLGAALRVIYNSDDYECRSRNRQPGGKLSEHGKGSAIDVRGLTLADGHFIALTDVMVSKSLRDNLRETACRRFMTVLGPGSDGYHEAHIHLDLAERRNGYRVCRWAVREPSPVQDNTGREAASVPASMPPAERGDVRKMQAR